MVSKDTERGIKNALNLYETRIYALHGMNLRQRDYNLIGTYEDIEKLINKEIYNVLNKLIPMSTQGYFGGTFVIPTSKVVELIQDYKPAKDKEIK